MKSDDCIVIYVRYLCEIVNDTVVNLLFPFTFICAYFQYRNADSFVYEYRERKKFK